MSRRANVNWGLPDGSIGYDAAAVAVLMDIREELRMLNQLLRCDNFLQIPWTLRRIATNTAKPKPKRKVRAA